MLLSLFLALLLQASPGQTKSKSDNNPSDKPTTATIRGKVTAGDTGAPIKGAQVTAQKIGIGQQAGFATTDAMGQFEIKNIDPGDYFLGAVKAGYLQSGYKKSDNLPTPLKLIENQEVNDINFLLVRAGVIAGTITDEFDEPLSGVMVQAMGKNYYQGRMQVQAYASATSDDRGQFRIHDLRPGRYYIRASKQGNANLVHYSSVLYPNATRIAEAQVVRMGEGEEIGGIKLAMHEAAVYTVSGKVVDERTGQAVSGVFLNVNPEDYSVGGSLANTQTQPDGSFHLAQMVPGRYMVWINMMDANARGRQQQIQRLLEVPERNVSGLTISIGAGATVKGVVSADGGDLPDKLTVSLNMRTSGGNFIASRQGQTDHDGTFEITELPSGTYEVQIYQAQMIANPSSRGSFFYTSSVTVGGHDVTESGVVVPEGVTNLEMAVRLDFRAGTISGKTLDAEGNPLPHATIAVVAADPAKRDGMRYFRIGRSDTSGTYSIGSVIPGDYLVLLWPQQDAFSILDPDVMKSVERFCASVSVTASATASQELRLIPEVQNVALSVAQQP